MKNLTAEQTATFNRDLPKVETPNEKLKKMEATLTDVKNKLGTFRILHDDIYEAVINLSNVVNNHREGR